MSDLEDDATLYHQWFDSRHPSEDSNRELPDHAPAYDKAPVLDEKTPQAPPSPVGFWNSALTHTRKQVFKQYCITCKWFQISNVLLLSLIVFILCIFVLVVLSLYWGVVSGIEKNLDRLTIAVVDFDGQPPYGSIDTLVGPAVVAAAQAELSTTHHVGFEAHSSEEYLDDPMNVRLAVYNEDVWAAIIINSNATALLREAVQIGNTSFDPLGMAQIVYNQARDQETYNQFITPALTQFASKFSTSFSTSWTSAVLQDTRYNSTIYSKSPQVLSPAVSFSVFNLRPFGPATTLPAVSLGLIYLIIIAFFSFGFFMPAHMKFVLPNPSSPHPPLKFYQLVIWRYLAAIAAYFFMSLSYSLVSLAFQIPFSHGPPIQPDGLPLQHWPGTEVVSNANYFHHATFVVYWAINFVGMTALGLACENMAMLLGVPWTALFLIAWVITNVATGFYTLELAPSFYRWGYAFPLRQIVMASKTLLFGTKSHLSMNFGILLAWIAVSTVLYPVFCCILRWKTIRQKTKEAQSQAKRISIV